MLSISRLRFLLGSLVALTMVVLTTSTSGAQDAKVNKKDIVIKTFDGVELEATLYPNSGGKREGTVILLHDFDLRKGGTVKTAGWSELAAALQADGYVVLAFDFRGFGGSKTVDPNVFWTKFHNKSVRKSNNGRATSIDAKNFPVSYVPYLLNDIAAVKAYLDRQNDVRDCNTSSTILIGAGDGAALGSLWMGHETRRRRDKNTVGAGIGIGIPMRPVLGDLESKDIAAAIWLSFSRRQLTAAAGGALNNCLNAASRVNKIPVAFVVGKNDSKAEQLSRTYVNYINPPKESSARPTASLKEIAGTKLAGDKLLDSSLGTEKWIIGALGKVMEDRGIRERVERKSTTSQYFYVHPAKNTLPKRLQKPVGEEVGMVDLREIPGYGN